MTTTPGPDPDPSEDPQIVTPEPKIYADPFPDIPELEIDLSDDRTDTINKGFLRFLAESLGFPKDFILLLVMHDIKTGKAFFKMAYQENPSANTISVQ